MKRLLLAGAFALAVHAWLITSHHPWRPSAASFQRPRKNVTLSLVSVLPAAALPAAPAARKTTVNAPKTAPAKPAAPKPKPKRAAAPPKAESKPAAPKAASKPLVPKPTPEPVLPPPRQAAAPAAPADAALSPPAVVEAPIPALTAAPVISDPSPDAGEPPAVDVSGKALRLSGDQPPVAALAPAAAGVRGGATDPPLVEARPRYRDNPRPKYPRRARRQGHQGMVVLEVLVNRDGDVEDLRLLSSSGFSTLDRAAAAAVKSWRFDAGRRGDHAVDMWVKVPVRFKLQ